jgi:oligopeptide transport system permease protein
MWTYALRRLLATIPTLLAVITLCYLLLHLTPGGPFDTERKVPEAVLANLQAKYHLNEPLWKQYLLYLGSLLQGDLGASFATKTGASTTWWPRPADLGGDWRRLAADCDFYRRGPGHHGGTQTKQHYRLPVMLISNVGSVFPSFVIGPVLILVFALWLGWHRPAAGTTLRRATWCCRWRC